MYTNPNMPFAHNLAHIHRSWPRSIHCLKSFDSTSRARSRCRCPHSGPWPVGVPLWRVPGADNSDVAGTPAASGCVGVNVGLQFCFTNTLGVRPTPYCIQEDGLEATFSTRRILSTCFIRLTSSVPLKTLPSSPFLHWQLLTRQSRLTLPPL